VSGCASHGNLTPVCQESLELSLPSDTVVCMSASGSLLGLPVLIVYVDVMLVEEGHQEDWRVNLS